MEPRIEFLTSDQSKRDNHRQWPTDLKARIVSESLRPGLTVQQVAERYGVRAKYLSSWRTLARQGKLVLPSPEDEMEFAAIIVKRPAVAAPIMPVSRVEIFSGSLIIRLEKVPPRPELPLWQVHLRLLHDFSHQSRADHGCNKACRFP